MARLLFWVLIGVGIYWLLRKFRRAGKSRAPDSALPMQEMVSCKQCGVHLPKSEALPGPDGVFCGEAHRAEFEKSRGPR